MENRLYRDENRKVIGGVCAGLADYFNIDDSIMRIIFVFAVVFLGTGFWLYIILWIVIPAKFTFTPGVDFSTMSPPPTGPVPVPKVRSASTFTIVMGAILIIFGSIFLLCEYDLLPDWEYHKLWPLIFIILGIAVMFGAGKKKAVPDQFENWNKEETEQNDSPETI
jgi:phage shock protein C